MYKFLLATLGLLIISGCSLKPDMPTIQQDFSYDYDVYSINEKWWENFDDIKLNTLIDEALKNNSDLNLALNSMEQAAANLNLANLDFLPNISLNADANKGRTSGETYTGQDNVKYDGFGLSAALNYEIDLWGRVRDNKNATKAGLNASKFDYQAARLSIASTVAQTYFTLISLNEQLEILQNTIKTYEDTVLSTKKRLEVGEVNESIYLQSQASLNDAKNRLLTVKNQISQTKTALAFLVGKNLNDILNFNEETAKALPDYSEVPDGISSDILLHRADVAAALERLKSSNYMIGVARTAWLPKLSITGVFGFSSDELNRLLIANANSWSVGGSLIMPLLDFGRTHNRVKLANLAKSAALINYDKVVKTAFKEIKNALEARKNYTLQEKNMYDLEQLQEKIYDLSKMKFEVGNISYTELLDIQRALLNSKLNLAQTKLRKINSVVDVFKALGGGFSKKDES